MINKFNQKDIRKIWKIIFAISLALNILIIGAVGGATFKHSKNEFKGISKLKDRQIGSFYIRALNQDQKDELRRKMRSQKITKKTIQANIEANRQETINILRNTQFDKNIFHCHCVYLELIKYYPPPSSSPCLRQEPSPAPNGDDAVF